MNTKRKCNKCGCMRTEEEYYTAFRKVCCYCDRDRAKEYKRVHSPSWKGEKAKAKAFKPINRRGVPRVKEAPKAVEVAEVVRAKREVPESLRVHVEALKRLREGS